MKISDVYNTLQIKFGEYLSESGLKSVVLGISGGIDSAILAALFSDVCSRHGVLLIGRYISIESNTKSERERADAIGKSFCSNYEAIDLTNTYLDMLPTMDDNFKLSFETDRQTKIRLGNFKARMRMMYLYNMAQAWRGMVLDTDNKTEHNLGFWTLHGDVGDYTPLIDLWKTDVYELSKYALTLIKDEKAYDALKSCIDAVPTDGLGITSSDVEQFGCKSYEEVDEVLKYITPRSMPFKVGVLRTAKENNTFRVIDSKLMDLSIKYSFESVISILERHVNSEYKRNNPYHVKLK